MIEGLISKALLANSDIVAQLAVFGSAPAIIAASKLPKDMALPAILITAVGSRDFACRDQTGSEMLADVVLYHDRENLSNKPLRTFAREIRKYLNRYENDALFAGEQLENCGVLCDAPVKQNDPDGFPGYRMQVMVRFLEV